MHAVSTSIKITVIQLIILLCLFTASFASDPPYSPSVDKAIVIVRNQYEKWYGTANGFAVGDGSLVVVNNHVVERSDGGKGLSSPMVISPYLGDACVAEILYANPDMDVAILRVPWKGHPTLQMASASEILSSDNMFVVAYPGAEITEMLKNGVPKTAFEYLPVSFIGKRSGKLNMISLAGITHIGPGWSGGPFIIPGSGKVAGIFAIRSEDTIVGWQAIASCTSDTLAKLIRKYSQNEPESPSVSANPNADKAFRAAMQIINAIDNNDKNQRLSAARELIRLRPHSITAQILMAQAANAGGDIELAKKHYQKAVDLAPDNALIRMEYALFLEKQGCSDEALANYTMSLKLSKGNGPAGIDPVTDLPGKLGMQDQAAKLEARSPVKRLQESNKAGSSDIKTRGNPSRIPPSAVRYRDAVVIVRNQVGYTVKISSGIVVNDGNYVLTNWSTVAYFSEKGRDVKLVEPMVISRYLGDACYAEIVYTDRSRDLAILRIPWNGHPSMPLATEHEIRNTGNAVLLACPEITRTNSEESSPSWVEPLSLKTVGTKKGAPLILLMDAGDKTQQWWRGAPIVALETGRMLSFVSNICTDDDSISSGCTSNIISDILKRLPRSEHCGPIQPPADSEKSYHAILDVCHAIFFNKSEDMLRAAREFSVLRPRSSAAYMLLAYAALRMEDNESADKYSREALELAPDCGSVRFQRAKLLTYMDRPHEASAEFQLAMRYVGKNFSGLGYSMLLDMLKETGKYREAAELARKALSIYPDDADIWFYLGSALIFENKIDEAMGAFETSLDLTPERWDRRMMLAEALAQIGKIEPAEAQYRKAMEYESENPDVWLGYSKFLISYRPDKKEEVDKALANARKYAGKDQKLLDQITELQTQLSSK